MSRIDDALDAGWDPTPEELHEVRNTEPGRSYSRAPLRILPALDDDGYDSDGWAWGAR